MNATTLAQRSEQAKAAINSDVIVPLRQKIGYSVGDLGYNWIYYWISGYLAIFLTDIFKINAAAVATLFLVIRIFDAVNDPIIGAMADKSKHGKRLSGYSKWLIGGSIGLAISMLFAFWAHPEWPEWAKILYMYVTYALIVCFSTATNMPYGVLNGLQTSNAIERTKITTMRMFIGSSFAYLTSGIVIPILLQATGGGLTESGGFTQAGYFNSVLICCIIGLALLIISAFSVKQRVFPPPAQKLTMKKRAVSVFKNPPIILAIIGMLFYGFLLYGRIATFAYYFVYVVKDVGLLTIFGLVSGVGSLIGNLLGPALIKATGNKGRGAAICLIVLGISTILPAFVSPMVSLVGFFTLSLVSSIASGTYSICQYALIPDACDYGQYKTGVRNDGFLYALVSFSFKAGNAFGSFLVVAIIGALGYIPNVEQTPTVIAGITAVFSWFPGIIGILGAIPYFFYKLSIKKHAEMMNEIAEKELITETVAE